MKYFFIALLSLMISSNSSGQSINTENIKDEERIKKVLTDFTDAWNKHDAKAFSNSFSEDADFIQIKQQKTTIGEINGEPSVCTKEIKALFESAGFIMAISTNMQAWLKIHAVFVACIAAAIIKEKWR